MWPGIEIVVPCANGQVLEDVPGERVPGEKDSACQQQLVPSACMDSVMISDTLDYIRLEIRDHLNVQDAEVSLGHLHSLTETANNPGVRISLVNVTEESTLRNMPHSVRNPSGQIEYQEPPVHLNLFIVMAFDFGNYQTDMIRLSETLELFQSKRFFDRGNQRPENPFPAILQRLIFDLHSSDFEQLNHLWGVMGGTYFPSLIYRVRLVRIQSEERVAGPHITTLQVDTGFRLP